MGSNRSLHKLRILIFCKKEEKKNLAAVRKRVFSLRDRRVLNWRSLASRKEESYRPVFSSSSSSGLERWRGQAGTRLIEKPNKARL